MHRLDYPHRCPGKPPPSGWRRVFPEDAPQRGAASLTGFSRGHSIPPNPAESRGSARAHHGPDAAAPNCLAPSAGPLRAAAGASVPRRHERRHQQIEDEEGGGGMGADGEGEGRPAAADLGCRGCGDPHRASMWSRGRPAPRGPPAPCPPLILEHAVAPLHKLVVVPPPRW
jgi:hypothetical protein